MKKNSKNVKDRKVSNVAEKLSTSDDIVIDLLAASRAQCLLSTFMKLTEDEQSIA